jgi:lipopolysaccharide export system protein LptA
MHLTDLQKAAASLTILLVSHVIYATLVVPLIEPPAPKPLSSGTAVGAATPSATDRYQADLEGLFEAEAWENQSPKILRNRNTLLLFKDYQPQDDGTLRVYPCTAVVLGDRSSDESRRTSSLILQAPEGAVLQLNRPVDTRGAQLGQPVAAFLLGKIRIHSRGQADGKGRLNILTSDVQIKPEMILTPHDVEFQYEQSHARGKDLMIKLMPLKDNKSLDQSQGWAGVRSIELIHLEQLHLEVDDQQGNGASPAAEPTPVDVACRGPMRVDFSENLVTLEEHVELRRHDPQGVVDTLHCQKLMLYLQQAAPPASDSSPTGAASTSTKPDKRSDAQDRLLSLPKLKIGKVVAEGDPVVLDAPSRHARIRSRRLLYDLQQGRFQLWAAPDDPADQVYLQYDRQEVVARELDGWLALPRGVRLIHAKGPGRFRGQQAGSPPQNVQADWQSSLVFEQQGPLHRLTLDQDARVQAGDSYGIEADVLHVWLEPTPRPAVEPPPTDTHPSIDLAFRPKRVEALADPDQPRSRPVRLWSSGLSATTEHMQAAFEHLPHRDAARTRAASPQSLARTSVPPASTLATDPSTPASTRETRVFGGTLNVQLRVRGREVTVDNLVLEQDVHVQQFAQHEPNRPLFDLRADLVRMQDPTAQQRHLVTAVGQPVKILSEQMQVQTHELNVDQTRNLVWTQRPGRMIVLVDRDASGKQLQKPQEMTIDWFRNMDFDGQVARFAGGVDVQSTDQRMRCEALDVLLNRQAGLGDSSSDAQLDVRQIRAKGNVLIESHEIQQGRTTSIARLLVPFAQIDRQTGDLRAGGPGRLVSLREGFRGDFNPMAGPTPRVAEAVAADAKTFMQVDYQREITGNFYRKVVDFSDRVKVIYGPVLSWNESLSADSPLRTNDVLLSCDRLTVAQGVLARGGQPMLDLLAQGNTYVEGQTFTARGDRVSYEQSKELLVLEGTGRADAALSHQQRVGAPRSETAARKILYWTRTGRVEIDDARYLDLSNLAN